MSEKKDFLEIDCVNSVFEQPWWLDTVAEGRWGECRVEEKGKVIARMPYMMHKTRHGIWLKNPSFTQTLGIWMDESLKEFKRGNGQLVRQKEVIKELLEQLPEHKGVSMNLDHSMSYVLPFRWHGFRIEPTFSYRIKYGNEFEEVRKNFSKNVQRDVTRALNKGIIVETSSKDYEAFFSLLDMTFERQNRKNPMDKGLVFRILTRASELGHGELMLAKDPEGNLHSGAFFLYDDKVCYYLFGGQNPKYKNSSSQDLVLYKGVEFGSTVSRAFDFEGSMIEGIENFFRKFGGRQVVNYHITRQPGSYDVMSYMKLRIKKLIGYKI